MNVEWNKLLGARGVNTRIWWIAAEERVGWLSGNTGRNEETEQFFPCLFPPPNPTGRYTRDKLVSVHSCLLCQLSSGCKKSGGRAGETRDDCGAHGGISLNPTACSHNHSGTKSAAGRGQS